MDTRSVSQIANFVVPPVETNWRSAPVEMLGRFVPRSEGGNAGRFRERDEDRFKGKLHGPTGHRPGMGSRRRQAVPAQVLHLLQSAKGDRSDNRSPFLLRGFFPVGTQASAVDKEAALFNTLLEGFQWIDTKRQY